MSELGGLTEEKNRCILKDSQTIDIFLSFRLYDERSDIILCLHRSDERRDIILCPRHSDERSEEESHKLGIGRIIIYLN